MMSWQLARPEELDHIVEFLSESEWRHVNFSSRLRDRSRNVFPNPHRISIYLNKNQSGGLREAVLVSRGGLILPVLGDDGAVTRRRDLAGLIVRDRRPLHSVMGLRRDTERVVDSLGLQMRATMTYDLLVQDPARVAGDSSPPSGLKFRRARPRDILPLYPLQKAYEKEEVLLEPQRYNATATYMNLQQHLRRELIYYAVAGRDVVAKAGTNARGSHFDQIGGVYTVESFRNQGVATALMNVLLDKLNADGRGVCLFVKKDNPAARRLYEKLGFATRDEFAISYFRP